jgi:hypothetical protein
VQRERRTWKLIKVCLVYGADVCWRMLTYADVCWRMLTNTCGSGSGWCRVYGAAGADVWRLLTSADVCWRMLTSADVCWRLLTYADVCWRMLTYADICWRMLTYADVCWRMLTYADVCWRIQVDLVAGDAEYMALQARPKKQNTAFTASFRARAHYY